MQIEGRDVKTIAFQELFMALIMASYRAVSVWIFSPL